MKNWLSYILILCIMPVTQVTFAQDFPEMPGPTKEHAWLAKFTGEWKTESKGTMGPEQPPMECVGTLSSRALGEFWIVNELKGDMAGTPMTGIQTIGYDDTKKKYVGTWVDSMSSTMWLYEGSVDASGKILTLQAEGPNFLAAGKLTQFQDVYEFTSEKEMKIISRMLGEDGKWITFMSGTGIRVK